MIYGILAGFYLCGVLAGIYGRPKWGGIYGAIAGTVAIMLSHHLHWTS